jgi:hypothetical protein
MLMNISQVWYLYPKCCQLEFFPLSLMIFSFFFGSTGVQPQDLTLTMQALYHLSHSTSPSLLLLKYVAYINKNRDV